MGFVGTGNAFDPPTHQAIMVIENFNQDKSYSNLIAVYSYCALQISSPASWCTQAAT